MVDEPVYRIALVRHGESVGNAEERLQGHADYPLSATGRAQATSLGHRWKIETVAFDHVIASPLSRALETGKIITSALGIATPEPDPLWIERDTGLNSGLTWDEVDRRHSAPVAEHARDAMPSSGEDDWSLYVRGAQALHSLLQRPPGRYLVISHRAILNMVLYSILGIPPQTNFDNAARFRIQNGSFSRFRYFPLERRWQVDMIGDRLHWSDDE